MLRIKFDYKRITDNQGNSTSATYYFATEALDYDSKYWEPRIIESFEIERFFDITTDTTNRIRTLSVTLDNSDKFFNQFVENGKTLLNNTMTLYYDNGNNVTKIFKGSVQSIDAFSSNVTLTLREIGYEYLGENYPDAQIAYDYYSENGINESWNAIPIHFGTVENFPISWVNSYYSEFMVGSGPILRITKIYIDTDRTASEDDDSEVDGKDNGVVYKLVNDVGTETNYKATDNSKELHVRIFRGIGYDADGNRETIIDTHRPKILDSSREIVNGSNVTHISQWGGFCYIQFYSLEEETEIVNGQEVTREYEIPAYPYNHDGSIGQVYVCLEGIVSVTKSGNNYVYGNEAVRNPAEIIKMMFCNKQFVTEAPCAIGFGYKEEDCDFTQAIKDCGPDETINGETVHHLNFKIDGSFNDIQQFSEALKKILYVCRGYICEDNEKITLKIDKKNEIVSASFDESGETGYDCILEEWSEPSLDEQINRVRINYKYNPKTNKFDKKPDPNHESPDYDATDPTHTSQYDSWLCDYDAYNRIKKWNTETLELQFVSDSMTAHKLGSYYLRKSLYQRIKGSITVANEHASALDAGNLIRIRSKQFNWYRTYVSGNTTLIDEEDGKLFQITSIKKGEENTTIEFLEYDPDIFLLDTEESMGTKTIPSSIKSKLIPKQPKSISISQSVVTGGNDGTNLVKVRVTIAYATNSGNVSAMIQYADMGTSQPANANSATWIDAASITGTTYDMTGLTPGHYYYFRAFTVNANGSSAARTTSVIKLLGDDVAPNAPVLTSLETGISGRSITFTATLTNAPSDFSGFSIYRGNDVIERVPVGVKSNKTAVLNYTYLNEEYETQYSFKAKSYDIWGNESESFSNTLTLTTGSALDAEGLAEAIERLAEENEEVIERLNGYTSDNILSVTEKARLAKDWLAIRGTNTPDSGVTYTNGRYPDTKSKAEARYFNSNASVYNADYLDFIAKYTALKNYVDGNGSVINLTPTDGEELTETESANVCSITAGYFADYYKAELQLLNDIALDDHKRAQTTYTECSTARTTAEKEVLLPDVNYLEAGLRICVKFIYGNQTTTPVTLNFKKTVDGAAFLPSGQGRLYNAAGQNIAIITFDAGTTITLVLVQKTIENSTVWGWEFSDSSILGLSEQDLMTGNAYSLGMVNGARIISETVDTQQLTAGAVTTEKLDAGAVTTEKLDAGSVTTNKLDARAVTSDKLDSAAVTTEKLDAGAVTTEKIDAGAVTTEKLTSNQIIGKDFRTSENVGNLNAEETAYIAGVMFNANGIKAYNENGQSVSIGTNGDITAISGHIGGWSLTSQSIKSDNNTMTLQSNGSIVVGVPSFSLNNVDSGTILSGDFSTGVSGWRIDSSGNAEFNSAIIRGKIQSAVFEYNKISAIGGQMLLKDASVVISDSDHTNSSTVLYVKDPNVFSVGDCFVIKKDNNNIFYGIISAIDNDTESDDYGKLTYSVPINGGTYFTPDNGQSVVNYGNYTSGGILFDGQHAYIDIFKNQSDNNAHVFSNDTIQLDHLVRLGNLNGVGGITTDKYGIYIGDSNGFIQYDMDNGLILNNNLTTGGFIKSENFSWKDENDNVITDIDETMSGGEYTNPVTAGEEYTYTGSLINLNYGTITGPKYRFESDGDFFSKGIMHFDSTGTPDDILNLGYTSVISHGNISIYNTTGEYTQQPWADDARGALLLSFVGTDTLKHSNTIRIRTGQFSESGVGYDPFGFSIDIQKSVGTGNNKRAETDPGCYNAYTYYRPLIALDNFIYKSKNADASISVSQSTDDVLTTRKTIIADSTHVNTISILYLNDVTGIETNSLVSSAEGDTAFYATVTSINTTDNSIGINGYSDYQDGFDAITNGQSVIIYKRGISVSTLKERIYVSESNIQNIHASDEFTLSTGSTLHYWARVTQVMDSENPPYFKFTLMSQDVGESTIYDRNYIPQAGDSINNYGHESGWYKGRAYDFKFMFNGGIIPYGDAIEPQLGSGHNRWENVYSKGINSSGSGEFGLASPSSTTDLNPKVEIGTDVSYGRGIRIYAGSQTKTGILLGGTELTSRTGTSANSWYITNETNKLYFYKNTTLKLACDTNGNWTMDGTLTNSSGFIGDLTGNAATATTASACSGNAATATTATNTNNAKLTHTVGNSEYPLVFGSSFVITDAQQALRIGTPSATAANCPLRIKAYCAAANTQGEAYLVLGNNLATASANNARGGLVMYGVGTAYNFIKMNTVNTNGKTIFLNTANTADITLTLPSATGTIALTSSNITGSSASCTGNAATATTASACSGNAASATYASNIRVTQSSVSSWYNLVYTSGITANTNYSPLVNTNSALRFHGTANPSSASSTTKTYAYLGLGNATACSNVAGRIGCLRMYGQSTGYTDVVPGYASTSGITLTLPSSTGTIALTSSNITGSSASCTGNAATATTASNANALKVTQTTGSWLPLLGCVAGTTSGNNSSIYSAVHTSSTGGNIAMTDNANGASAASYIQLGNSTACSSSSTTGRYGRIRMYGTNTKRLDFYVGNQTTDYNIALLGTGSVTLTLPSSTGTLALTSQIPSEYSENPCSYVSGGSNYDYVYYDRIASDGKKWRFLFINIPVAKISSTGYTFTIPSPYALDWEIAKVIAVCAGNSTSHYPRATEGSPRAGFTSSSSIFASPGAGSYTSGVNIMAVYRIV